MRNAARLVIALAVTLAVGGWSKPAVADVDVLADIDKYKNIYVTVDVFIQKYVDIFVTQVDDLDGAAEAQAIINQTNEDNFVDDNGAERPEQGSLESMALELDAYIGDGGDDDDLGSVNNNDGIVGVNQDVGNMVNQANVVAFALTDSPTSVTHSEAFAEQINTYNFARQDEVLEEDDSDPNGFNPDRTAIIENSVNENAGIVGVNQNAGNNNNQANGVAMSVGEGSHLALAESSLGQVNTWNYSIGESTYKTDLISNSVNLNTGVVGVNQTVGNNNNQGSVTSFSVLTSTTRIDVPGSNGL